MTDYADRIRLTHCTCDSPGQPRPVESREDRMRHATTHHNQVEDRLHVTLNDLASANRAAREALAERDKARAIVEAIDAIHQPFTRAGEQWCTGCSHGDGARYHFLAAWPCATNKAISTATPDA